MGEFINHQGHRLSACNSVPGTQIRIFECWYCEGRKTMYAWTLDGWCEIDGMPGNEWYQAMHELD